MQTEITKEKCRAKNAKETKAKIPSQTSREAYFLKLKLQVELET